MQNMMYVYNSRIQWNRSIEGTIEIQLAVQYGEVSLIQRQIYTQLNVIETADSVHIREVFLIQSVLYREVPLYCAFSLISGACWLGAFMVRFHCNGCTRISYSRFTGLLDLFAHCNHSRVSGSPHADPP